MLRRKAIHDIVLHAPHVSGPFTVGGEATHGIKDI